MPELTPAQKKKRLLLETQSDAVAEGRSASASAAPEAVSLSVMLGEGGSVLIGKKQYEVAAFPVSKLSIAGKLISECPDLMVSAALSASGGNEVGVAQTTETLNRLMKQAQPNAEEISETSIAYAFSTMAMNVTESEAAAMTPLAVLALSRRHPGITEADIEDDLDAATFLVLLCRIFDQNQALRNRF